MKALEVFVNGERVCVAGVGRDGVLSAIIDWTGSPDSEDHFGLHVGGLDGDSSEHLGWEVPTIDIGTEVLVRILDVTNVDSPSRRVRYEKQACVDEYRQHLRECGQWLTLDERRQMLRELIAELNAADTETTESPT